MSLLENDEFNRLAKEYPLLNRARPQSEEKPDTLESMPCVVLDIETTGLEPTLHEVIEIGALSVKDLKVMDVFNMLIKPGIPISDEIEKLTGIHQPMVDNALGFKEIAGRFLRFIGNRTLIAHNTDFDITFLKHHLFKELGVKLENPSFCTLRIARQVIPGLSSYKLQSIADHLKVKNPLHHRALPDAETTYLVWLKLVDLLKQKNIRTPRELAKIIA